MDFLKDLSIDKVRNLAEDAFNQAKPKTETEAKLYEVLSHKNWGSSSTLMNEIARDTYDYDKFGIISTIMWESMENQRPAAWRVVFKGLSLLEHLIKNGSERCVDDARNHGHVLRALHQFNYYEGTVDRGVGVREKSKQLIEILGDDERVREERMKARKLREKFAGKLGGVSGGGGGGGGGGGSSSGGYGNDNWNSGGGYGDGGIDSGSGRGYGGRYDNDEGVRSHSRNPNIISTAHEPTFAAMPSETKKTKKKKSKKPPEPAPAPEVDLFSFDATPAPAPAAPPVADEFGAFESGGGGGAGNSQPDPFASPPAPAAASFDAFGQSSMAPPPQQQANGGFNAFGQPPQQQQANLMMNQNNAFGGAPQMQQPQQANMMMGAGMNQTAPAPAAAVDDDDFGDFATADKSQPKMPAASSANAPSDPMSRLISLDHLSINPSKKKTSNNPNQQNQGTKGQQNGGMAMNGQQNGGMGMNTPNMLGMATAGGSDAISGLMDPGMLAQQQKQKQAGMGGMPQQAGGGMPGGFGGMPQQGGMPGGFGGMPQQGGGGIPGGFGGMPQQGGGMPGGFGGMNQQQMMMNQQGGAMGGMGMGNQQGFGGMGAQGMGQQQGGMQGFGMQGMQQGMGNQQGGMQGFGGQGGQQMPGGW